MAWQKTQNVHEENVNYSFFSMRSDNDKAKDMMKSGYE